MLVYPAMHARYTSYFSGTITEDETSSFQPEIHLTGTYMTYSRKVPLGNSIQSSVAISEAMTGEVTASEKGDTGSEQSFSSPYRSRPGHSS